MKIEYETYVDLIVSCKKISNNAGRVRKDHVEVGAALFKPTKYRPYFVGMLRTNLVIKILEDNGTNGKFLTYSGSIYEWEIISVSHKIHKTITNNIDDIVVKSVDEMVIKYDNLNKLINKL